MFDPKMVMKRDEEKEMVKPTCKAFTVTRCMPRDDEVSTMPGISGKSTSFRQGGAEPDPTIAHKQCGRGNDDDNTEF